MKTNLSFQIRFFSRDLLIITNTKEGLFRRQFEFQLWYTIPLTSYSTGTLKRLQQEVFVIGILEIKLINSGLPHFGAEIFKKVNKWRYVLQCVSKKQILGRGWGFLSQAGSQLISSVRVRGGTIHTPPVPPSPLPPPSPPPPPTIPLCSCFRPNKYCLWV